MTDKRIKLLALAAAGAVIIIACVFIVKGSRSADRKENGAAGAVSQTETGVNGTGGNGTGVSEADGVGSAAAETDGVGSAAAETDAGENAITEADGVGTGVTESDTEKTKRESQKAVDTSKDAVIPAAEGVELPEMILEDDAQKNDVQQSDAGNLSSGGDHSSDQQSDDDQEREEEGVELPFVPFR